MMDQVNTQYEKTRPNQIKKNFGSKITRLTGESCCESLKSKSSQSSDDFGVRFSRSVRRWKELKLFKFDCKENEYQDHLNDLFSKNRK